MRLVPGDVEIHQDLGDPPVPNPGWLPDPNPRHTRILVSRDTPSPMVILVRDDSGTQDSYFHKVPGASQDFRTPSVVVTPPEVCWEKEAPRRPGTGAPKDSQNPVSVVPHKTTDIVYSSTSVSSYSGSLLNLLEFITCVN